MMIEELYIMSKFENWTLTGMTESNADRSAFHEFKDYENQSHLHWIFLATRSGITAYWRLYYGANEDHIRLAENEREN